MAKAGGGLNSIVLIAVNMSAWLGGLFARYAVAVIVTMRWQGLTTLPGRTTNQSRMIARSLWSYALGMMRLLCIRPMLCRMDTILYTPRRMAVYCRASMRNCLPSYLNYSIKLLIFKANKLI